MNALTNSADVAHRDVITVFSIKFDRKLSKNQKRKERAKLGKVLLKQGMLGQHVCELWLVVSKAEHSAKQVEHTMLASTLMAKTVEQLTLSGSYSFMDFFVLNQGQLKRKADGLIRHWGIRLAQNLLRDGCIQSPAGRDLQASLHAVSKPGNHVSRINVRYGA